MKLSAIQAEGLWWLVHLGAIRNPAWQHWHAVPLLPGWTWYL